MASTQGGKSLSETLLEESAKPLTIKDRIVGVVLAVAFAGAGTAMVLWPAFLSPGDADPSGRGGRTIAFLLEVAWSRPVGIILIVLALLILWGSMTKKSAP